MIEVLRAGALTTIQDLGRPGFAASGVPRGGAMDPWAARRANRLLGNPDGAALLEITLAGPTLRFEEPTTIALVGDSFEIEVEKDGERERPVEDRLETIPVTGRTTIHVGRARGGVRAWLAVAGGLDLQPVLGSRSTELAGAFGGIAGRALVAGDRLKRLPAMEISDLQRRRGWPRASANPGGGLLRVLTGPDAKLLKSGAVRALEAVGFHVDPRSDRRGVRLRAEPPISLIAHPPLRSQPVLPGAVQLPPSGDPIVLSVDAPVTGGYPWVAQVIEADVGRLAHLAPGSRVHFVTVDPKTAERALAERRAELPEPTLEGWSWSGAST